MEGEQDVGQSAQVTADEFRSGGDSAAAIAPSQPPEGGAPPPAPSQPATDQAAATPSFRDFVQGMGYQLDSTITDDYTAVRHLVERATQAQKLDQQLRQQSVMAQLGHALAPRAREINDYLAQQKPPEARKPWQPPEFDERWGALLDVDQATGLYIAKSGVPPEIAQKANVYAQWMTDFRRDPAKALQPLLVEERKQALEEARVEMRQMLAQEQTNQRISQIVETNSPWFYAKDQFGNAIPDPVNGGRMATPLGREYVEVVKTLGQYGVADPAAKDYFARLILAPKLQATQAQQQTAGTDRQAQALRAQGARNRNPLQALAGSARDVTPGATEPDRQGLSLAEMIRDGLKAEGVTDADYFAEVG